MEEDRIQKAVELFKSGYNCSQSVVAAFADMYGFTQEQALRMAASFGGGIGRMRETCGAACGLFLVAGLKTGATEAADREGNHCSLRSGQGHEYQLARGKYYNHRKESGSDETSATPAHTSESLPATPF